MNRRTFFRIMGMGSLSVAAGCTSRPDKALLSHIQAPEDMVTGEATWYASTCRECPAGCGILAKNREGRVVKVEGNPLHPINQGRLCMRGQAALQGVYNPDRIKTPLLRDGDRWRTVSFPEAEALLDEKATKAAARGRNRIRTLTEATGESMMALFSEAMARWNSGPPLIFEPYAYESLKAANQRTFGIEGLISYRMEEADLLISFGADFLETWLSPVEYTRKFKEMHRLREGKKALFFHVSPNQSLTGANADAWFSCRPGGEAAIVLGLLREALRGGKGAELPEATRSRIEEAAAPYTKERVLELSGLAPESFERMLHNLLRSSSPLILGTGTGGSGGNALETNIAVNLLNLVLDPDLSLLDFYARHRIEAASSGAQVLGFFDTLEADGVDLLLQNNVNPVYSLPAGARVNEALGRDSLFVVSFSNFMDETTGLADLVLPVQLPLESWDEYGGKQNTVSTLQPTMGSLTGAPGLGDVLIRAAFGDAIHSGNYKTTLYARFLERGDIRDEISWVEALQQGGIFGPAPESGPPQAGALPEDIAGAFGALSTPRSSDLTFIAAPSLRFFDGRGANRPWLCEVPNPLTKVAWHTPVLVHPETLQEASLKQGDVIRIQSEWGSLEAPVYETGGVRPGVLAMETGQGHEAYGRYAEAMGLNPYRLLGPDREAGSGAPVFGVGPLSIQNTGRSLKLASMDGSRVQHGRKIALSIGLKELTAGKTKEKHGLAMAEFPLTLPVPVGYDRERDFYPAHEHANYRWVMVVDLDRCIGCAACAVACYAENNVGVVGLERILEQREMAWLWIERYQDPKRMEKVTFLPMLCQHCDNAPCESVCPVYAPHHSKEGLNNQIYNRCIGTRFCGQNCPYKARRFNWFDWKHPDPLHLQLNPDVTVRSKGVMEKCSFCVQRIKEAHGRAKNEEREIQDGEVQPACVQTCPAGVLTFGNLMDKKSRVSQMVHDKRAYQVMGYLNTKPGVIYLKKVVQEV